MTDLQAPASPATFTFEVYPARNYNPAMSISLLSSGGPIMWLLLLAGAVAVAVFVERWLYYHRAQINSTEFLNGVRNVLKRDNIVEAVSICDATPGPIARLVKVAILNRERGRDGVRESLEEAGLLEVPRLEERLNLLATITQIAPLLGLLGTVLGFINIFRVMQENGAFAHAGLMSEGVDRGRRESERAVPVDGRPGRERLRIQSCRDHRRTVAASNHGSDGAIECHVGYDRNAVLDDFQHRGFQPQRDAIRQIGRAHV